MKFILFLLLVFFICSCNDQHDKKTRYIESNQLIQQKNEYRAGLYNESINTLNNIKRDNENIQIIHFRRSCLKFKNEKKNSFQFNLFLSQNINSKNQKIKCEALILQAEYFYNTGDLEKSLKLVSRAHFLALKNKFDSDLPSIYFISGNIKFKSNQKRSAKIDYLKGISISDKKKDSYLLSKFYCNLGNTNNDLGNSEKAISCYFKSIYFSNKIKASNFILVNYVNLINVFLEQKEEKKAENILIRLEQLNFKAFTPDEYISSISLRKLIKLNFLLKTSNWSKLKLELEKIDETEMKVGSSNYLSFLYIKISLYKHLNNNEIALQLWEEYKLVNEEILNETTKNSFQNYISKFDNMNKIIENNELKLKNLKFKNEQSKNKTIFTYSLISLFMLFVVLFFLFRNQQLKSKQKISNAFTVKLLTIQDDLKKWISMEIHDEIGVKLSFIRMQLSLLINGVNIDFVKLEEETLFIIKKLRSISHELFPNSIRNLNLIESINDLLIEIRNISGNIDTTFNYNELGLNELQSIQIFRILQECCNNTLKHTNASQIKINLIRNKNKIILEYYDNGKGTDFISKTGLGMEILEERVNILNGKYERSISNLNGFKLKVIFNQLN